MPLGLEMAEPILKYNLVEFLGINYTKGRTGKAGTTTINLIFENRAGIKRE